MKRLLTLALSVALLPMATAQTGGAGIGSHGNGLGKPGPPFCGGVTPAKHPSISEIEKTQGQNEGSSLMLPSSEPVPNFGVERYRLRDYAECTTSIGCYWSDLNAQVYRAQRLMEDEVKGQPTGRKLAIVLDIDETALTNYCEEVREDFGYIPDRYDAWTVSPEAAMAIGSTNSLFLAAQSLGVDVFFITGRPESQRYATVRNLEKVGYRNWKNLSMKQPGVTYASTSAYKAAERKKITEQGYTLILNMGDQWSDLQGEPMARYNVKLPNPFYYLP